MDTKQRGANARGGMHARYVAGVLNFYDASKNVIYAIDTVNGGVTFTDAVTASAGVIGDITGDLTGQVVHNDNVRSKRVRVSLGELNAGHTLLPAVAGYGYRILDFTMIAVGGGLGTATSIEIEGDQSGAVDLFSVAAAQLTQSAVNKPDGAGTTVLADGASFAVCSDNTAITISATGTADTLSNVDVILTYTLET